ncbi:MAG TPA: sugar ABC transporter permease [Ruminiclostridium sp.]
MKHKYAPYLLIAPFFIIYSVFQLFPILFSFVVSFTNWTVVGSRDFVGLANYSRLISDHLFFKSVGNTLLVMVIAIPLEVIMGLFMAVFLKDFANRSRSTLQLINFLPYITTPVAMGMLFQLMFDYNNGTVNQILSAIGIIDQPIYWLGNTLTARTVVVLLIFWRTYGYMMVMFLTGLSTIPNELYEAAKVDGASWFTSFTKITVPLLRPIMTFVVTMSIIGGWKLFDEARLLFSGGSLPSEGPNNSILTIVMNYYNTSFSRFEFGYGSAMGYGLFAIIFAFSLISMKIMNRGEES